MMENMDSSIGMVLDKLKALGLEENTYVIFSSDNGGGQSNAPLQGGKAKMWEGGLRIPMIVAGPGIAANSQCDKPVAQWDYLTTMHDLVGSTAALPDDLDGVSLRPILEQGNDGQLAKRDTGLVFHFPAHYTVPITSYRDGDYKLMRHLNTGEIKLFNVARDMGESNDLSKNDAGEDSRHGSQTGCLSGEGRCLDDGRSLRDSSRRVGELDLSWRRDNREDQSTAGS